MAIKHQTTPKGCEYATLKIEHAWTTDRGAKSKLTRQMTALTEQVTEELTGLKHNRRKMTHAVINPSTGRISLVSMTMHWDTRKKVNRLMARARGATFGEARGKVTCSDCFELLGDMKRLRRTMTAQPMSTEERAERERQVNEDYAEQEIQKRMAAALDKMPKLDEAAGS